MILNDYKIYIKHKKKILKNEVFEENKFSPEGASKPLKGEDTKGAIYIH